MRLPGLRVFLRIGRRRTLTSSPMYSMTTSASERSLMSSTSPTRKVTLSSTLCFLAFALDSLTRLGVDVDAHAPFGAEILHGLNHDPAVAAAQVEDGVVFRDLAQLAHLVHHIVRRRHPADLDLFAVVGLGKVHDDFALGADRAPCACG